MNVEIRTYVVGLLESYQKRSRQIELLHYELSHPVRVSQAEMIGALAFAHGDGGGHPGGHVSDKTLYIAMNYQERADKLNLDVKDELVTQLVALEKEQERLKYYVSLLKERHRKAIQLIYFDGMTNDETAETMNLSVRSVHSIKAQAVDALAEMYDYITQLH